MLSRPLTTVNSRYDICDSDIRRPKSLSLAGQTSHRSGRRNCRSNQLFDKRWLIVGMADLVHQLNWRSNGKYVSPYDMAAIWVGLGRIDQSVEWLQKTPPTFIT
jgi:hypothetical protein